MERMAGTIPWLLMPGLFPRSHSKFLHRSRAGPVTDEIWSYLLAQSHRNNSHVAEAELRAGLRPFVADCSATFQDHHGVDWSG